MKLMCMIILGVGVLAIIAVVGWIMLRGKGEGSGGGSSGAFGAPAGGSSGDKKETAGDKKEPAGGAGEPPKEK